MVTMQKTPQVRLWAETAANLMMSNPVSIRDNCLVREAIVLLTSKGFSAAPVIDEAGRPVGVISRSDILVHDRETVEYLPNRTEFFHDAELKTPNGERLPKNFQVEKVDRTRVRDLMTPAVLAVAPDTSAIRVIQEMLSLRVHRLFVVDSDGILVGVISALDVLRHLRP
jgi:CBS domain-containing protein